MTPEQLAQAEAVLTAALDCWKENALRALAAGYRLTTDFYSWESIVWDQFPPDGIQRGTFRLHLEPGGAREAEDAIKMDVRGQT